MKIAHISDPHFFSASYSLSQFFSKRWIGNLNLLFNRKNELFIDRLCLLPLFFKSKGVTDVIVSGDMTTTSKPEEFEQAMQFVRQFENEGMRVIVIPGNHDHYTKQAGKQRRFYNYFPKSYEKSKTGHPNLLEDRHTVLCFGEKWAMVLVDTTVATPLHLSTGLFSNALEQKLKNTLNLLEDRFVIVVNHFPFLNVDKKHRRLERADKLHSLLKQCPQVRMYWHGHTHRKIIADLRESGLPVVLDPGSISYKKGSFFISDITDESVHLTSYHWSKSHWVMEQKARFKW